MAVSSPNYRFKGFTLNLDQGRLYKDGVELMLRPKSTALLVYFAHNVDQLLSKRELLDALWPGVHVTEDSLTQCVRGIRRVLDDIDGSLLRTVPRRGYVFAIPQNEAARAESVVENEDRQTMREEPAKASIAVRPVERSRPDVMSVLQLCEEGRVPVPNSWLP